MTTKKYLKDLSASVEAAIACCFSGSPPLLLRSVGMTDSVIKLWRLYLEVQVALEEVEKPKED